MIKAINYEKFNFIYANVCINIMIFLIWLFETTDYKL